ncbi:hypothetical protein ADK96_02190 [Streptomyces sp. IGB124]|nr:hypothetical protein ADK96_02190 [Streptomyces sp. IGB124]
MVVPGGEDQDRAGCGDDRQRPELVRFNKARMDTYDPATRRMVAAHELGHALGLCHKSGSGKNAVSSVMWPDAAQYPDAPTDVDKANLKKLWG